MAEHSDQDRPKKQSTYYQNNTRNFRGATNVNRVLQHLGVTDLRDHLNRRREVPLLEGSGPPPDPSYCFLKDPLRDNTPVESVQHTVPRKTYVHRNRNDGSTQPIDSSSPWNRKKERENYNQGRGRRFRGRRTGNQSCSQHLPLHNPINIKIEVQATTGERTCTLDGNKTLEDIRHVPDYNSQHLRGRGRGARGRRMGRGRGRGHFRGGRGANHHNSEILMSPKEKEGIQSEGENWDNDDQESNAAVNNTVAVATQKVDESSVKRKNGTKTTEDIESGGQVTDETNNNGTKHLDNIVKYHDPLDNETDNTQNKILKNLETDNNEGDNLDSEETQNKSKHGNCELKQSRVENEDVPSETDNEQNGLPQNSKEECMTSTNSNADVKPSS